MRLIIEPNYEQVSAWAANYVASRINAAHPTPEKPFVLGCPTGSSPLGMYRKLIELNKAGKVSFQNVITFNMDLARPRYPLPGFLPKRNENLDSHKTLYVNVYSGFIHNCQKTGNSTCPLTDKYTECGITKYCCCC